MCQLGSKYAKIQCKLNKKCFLVLLVIFEMCTSHFSQENVTLPSLHLLRIISHWFRARVLLEWSEEDWPYRDDTTWCLSQKTDDPKLPSILLSRAACLMSGAEPCSSLLAACSRLCMTQLQWCGSFCSGESAAETGSSLRLSSRVLGNVWLWRRARGRLIICSSLALATQDWKCGAGWKSFVRH